MGGGVLTVSHWERYLFGPLFFLDPGSLSNGASINLFSTAFSNYPEVCLMKDASGFFPF